MGCVLEVKREAHKLGCQFRCLKWNSTQRHVNAEYRCVKSVGQKDLVWNLSAGSSRCDLLGETRSNVRWHSLNGHIYSLSFKVSMASTFKWINQSINKHCCSWKCCPRLKFESYNVGVSCWILLRNIGTVSYQRRVLAY